MRRTVRRGSAKPLSELLWNSLPEGAKVRIRVAASARNWESVVGPLLAKRSAPKRIVEGKLLVVAESPAAAQELVMRGARIVKNLEREWHILVSGITVSVGRVPPPPRGGALPEDRPLGSVPAEEVHAALDVVAEKVERDDVAESLARLMAVYRKRFPGRTGGAPR
jgi:hypothetical protein